MLNVQLHLTYEAGMAKCDDSESSNDYIVVNFNSYDFEFYQG